MSQPNVRPIRVHGEWKIRDLDTSGGRAMRPPYDEHRSMAALPEDLRVKFERAEELRERRHRWTARGIIAAIWIAGVWLCWWAFRNT